MSRTLHNKNVALSTLVISLLLSLFICFSFHLTTARPPYKKVATIYYNGADYKLAEDVMDLKNGVAIAVFSDEVFVNGWGKLNITSSEHFDEDVQMYASGFLEGHLTRQMIYDHAVNQYFVYGFPLDNIPPQISSFMNNNLKFMREQVNKYTEQQQQKVPLNHHKKNDDNIVYWKHVGLVLKQMEGLVAGYNYQLPDESMRLSELQLFMLNAAGDLEDLVPALTNKQFKTMKQKIFEYINEEHDDTDEPLTDCSALVKFTGKDLFVGHTTWRSFGIIDKMYKVYNFALNNVAARRVSFSSSPGFLSSKDDFYIMQESSLVTMETTNSIFNTTLYDRLTPQSVLCWVRSIVANQLANNGKQWTDIFAKYNSGSYNNQWMVIDYKLVTPDEQIKNNTLWILEQIPGYTQSADVSHVLRAQGFWSSFNIPYFKYIYDISGYPEMKKKSGDDFDYKNCPRAKIFEREQANVQYLSDFGKVLQFNKWQTDPLSLGLPSMAIAARYDLRQKKPVPFGGIDSKVTSIKMMKKLMAVGIAGPTHQDQVPFSWSTQQWNVSHLGQPDTWNFDWIVMQDF